MVSATLILATLLSRVPAIRVQATMVHSFIGRPQSDRHGMTHERNQVLAHDAEHLFQLSERLDEAVLHSSRHGNAHGRDQVPARDAEYLYAPLALLEEAVRIPSDRHGSVHDQAMARDAEHPFQPRERLE